MKRNFLASNLQNFQFLRQGWPAHADQHVRAIRKMCWSHYGMDYRLSDFDAHLLVEKYEHQNRITTNQIQHIFTKNVHQNVFKRSNSYKVLDWIHHDSSRSEVGLFSVQRLLPLHR